MSQRHTSQDPEQLSQVTIAEDLTRNVHGESLDDARAEFRAEWQGKIERKWEQAEQERQKARRCRQIAEFIFSGALGFGAYFGAVIGFFGGLNASLPGMAMCFFAGVGMGAVFGLVTVIPFLLVVTACWLRARRYTERLENELRELERS